MSPRTFVTRGAALVALALGIAACETKTIVSPPPADVQVSVTPASATLTATGQTVQFVALVTGVGTNGSTAVTWKSSNTAVATVAASGNTATVTAVANGTASIIATSTQDPTRQGAGLVTVQFGTGGGTVPPTVSIASITTGGNLQTPANLSAIAGTIVITANVDQGQGNTINAVNFNLGGKTICSQTLTQGKSAGDATVQSTSAVSFNCQIKTDSTVAGVPVYPNANYTLTVSVVGPNNTQLASASQGLTFANVNGFGVTASGAKTATASSGLVWQGGTLTVAVTPKVFDTSVLSKITVTVGGVSQTQTVTGNGAINFTFRADTAGGVGLLGIMGDPVDITVSGVTAAGQPFTGAGAATVRYDDQGPTVGDPDLTVLQGASKGMGAIDLAGNNWLNATAVFSVSNFHSTTSDNGGVGGVTTTFQFSTDGGDTWTTDSTIAQLGEQAAGSVIARLVSCDKLGNCTNSNETADFGVDLTPPVVQSVTTPDTIFNPATAALAEVVMTLQSDNLSGFGANLVKVQIQKDSASSSGADVTRCLDDLAGTLKKTSDYSSGKCPFIASASSTIGMPAAAGNGYFTVAIYGMDAAGNKTATTTKFILVDRVGGFFVPTISIVSRGLTGNIPNVSANINDNVDLGTYQPFAVFAGALAGTTVTTLPMGAATTVSTFGLPIAGMASPSATLPFSSVQAALGNPAIVTLSDVGFTAKDVAGNTPGLVTQPQAGGTTGVNATDIIAAAVSANPTQVCTSGTSKTECTNPSPAITATSTTLSAAIRMNNAANSAANPIKAVYFYTFNAATNTIGILLGSSSAASFGVNVANERVFTFSATASASSFPNFGAGGVANTVFAIGVDANGNGVALGTATVTAF